MTDELRAAAERLRQVHQNILDCEPCWLSSVYAPFGTAPPNCDYGRDRDIVTAAYLAEHPADDADPIKEAWLRSVGFKSGGMFVSAAEMIHVYLYCGDEWHANILQNSHTISVGAVKTRGDVRRLCSALGIALQEATT